MIGLDSVRWSRSLILINIMVIVLIDSWLVDSCESNPVPPPSLFSDDFHDFLWLLSYPPISYASASFYLIGLIWFAISCVDRYPQALVGFGHVPDLTLDKLQLCSVLPSPCLTLTGYLFFSPIRLSNPWKFRLFLTQVCQLYQQELLTTLPYGNFAKPSHRKTELMNHQDLRILKNKLIS